MYINKEGEYIMNAIISVLGQDTYGILAKTSTECAKYKANIVEVSQSILKDYFAMIMVCNIDNLTIDFNSFVDLMEQMGKENNLKIQVMHEDIFNSMHRI